MQLRTARLCANCENIHDESRCPACGSETFAYLTKWVPTASPEKPQPTLRRTRPRLTKRIVLGSSILGLTAFWVGRWARRAKTELEEHSLRGAGELR